MATRVLRQFTGSLALLSVLVLVTAPNAVPGPVQAAPPVAGSVATSTPGWDVTGPWSGFVGDLQLTQTGDGSLSGRFVMKFGCTETYLVSGRIDGTAVTLWLVRANGGGDEWPCAGTQTLNGEVEPSGRVMALALVNFAQSSPAAPFTGEAVWIGEEPRYSKDFAVDVRCGTGRQMCRRAFVGTVRPPAGTLGVRFATWTGHCSDVRLRISVDGGRERVSPFISPGSTTPEYTFQVTAGAHRITVRAEGRRGGCNHGDLRHWAGTLMSRSVG